MSSKGAIKEGRQKLRRAQLIGDVIRHGNMRDEALYGFLRDTANVRFLFDEPIVAYLTELKNKCIEIQALASTFERLPVGEERTALVAQKTERFQWISAQYDLIEARFAPHMSLE